MKQGKVKFFILAVIEYLSMIANETSGSLIKPNLLRKRKHPAVELYF